MAQNLYVGNLSYDATEADIRDLFEEEGLTVVSVNLTMDRDTGRPRGFGFVEVDGEGAAQKAIEAFNERRFLGRNLTVNEARPRNGGGGGGRDGGGGRGRPGGRRGY